MDDLISRQAAIDVVRDYLIGCQIEDGDYHADGIMYELDRLPSVQEQRWIPVTERLPEEGLVIVACGKDGDALYVASADAVRESAYEGYVKAWMQIEPWKGGDDEPDK